MRKQRLQKDKWGQDHIALEAGIQTLVLALQSQVASFFSSDFLILNLGFAIYLLISNHPYFKLSNIHFLISEMRKTA